MKMMEHLENEINRTALACRNDPHSSADIVETLVDSAGYILAQQIGDNPKALNSALEGLSDHLFRAAAAYNEILRSTDKKCQ
jgi:hypothetical protein